MEDSNTNDANGINSSWDPEIVNVLKDKTYIMGNDNLTYSMSGRVNEIKINMHMKWNKKWNYISTSADIAADLTKVVYFVVLTEHVATNVYTLYNYGAYKVNFIDI